MLQHGLFTTFLGGGWEKRDIPFYLYRKNGRTRPEDSSLKLCTHRLVKASRCRQSRYLARVGDVVVVVVDDRCPLLIELDPALAAQLSQGVTCRDTTDSLLKDT